MRLAAPNASAGAGLARSESSLDKVAPKMLCHRVIRRVKGRGILALCGGLALSACGAHYAQVPARLSLQPYGRIALVTFSTEESDKELSTTATRRFAEALLSSQSGVELLELSSADASRQEIRYAPATFRPWHKLSDGRRTSRRSFWVSSACRASSRAGQSAVPAGSTCGHRCRVS